MITAKDYFTHTADVVPAEHTVNAGNLLTRVNRLLAEFAKENPNWPIRVNSGYRPAAYNATVKGAAPNSNHTLGRAIDIADDSARTLACWCFINYRQLIDFDLWCEDPRSTPTWVHFQSVPPRSGIRFYLPTAEWAKTLGGTPLTLQTIKQSSRTG